MITTLADALIHPSPSRDELVRREIVMLAAMRGALAIMNANPEMADSPNTRMERAAALLREGIRRVAD